MAAVPLAPATATPSSAAAGAAVLRLHRCAFMAAQRGRRAPRDASGTRGAIKAKTYVSRFVIKNADRGRTHWHAGPRYRDRALRLGSFAARAGQGERDKLVSGFFSAKNEPGWLTRLDPVVAPPMIIAASSKPLELLNPYVLTG
jgi:hypothetical protein